jgi:hypothetical protein
VVLVTVTLCTPPESKATLQRFYTRCRPPGFWKPVRGANGVLVAGDPTMARQIIDSAIGIATCLMLVLATNAIFARDGVRVAVSTGAGLMLGAWLLKRNRAHVPAEQAGAEMPARIEP